MKYLGYYDVDSNKKEKRKYILAATNKMTYIANTVAGLGKTVEIISASPTEDSRGYYGKTYSVANNVTVKLFSTIGRKSKVSRIANVLLSRFHVLKYLLTETKVNEPILVYHSLGYSREVLFAKRVKKFKLILEVEELYGDVIGNEKTRKHELKFADYADAYVFPTKLLNELINTKGKPATIIHGTYQVEQDRNCSVFSGDFKGVNSRIIHCVYAGTFDSRKGGSIAAVAAAEFLPSNYHIHIIGFGTPADTQRMKETISRVAKTTEATVTYDGLYSGEDYIRFIQSCDIGLSTQNPDAAFNATSFPSKVLSYLANGLHVVSIRIPAIEQSAVGDMLSYYEHQTPEEIAKAIMAVDVSKPYNSRKRISDLDNRFKTEIGQLIER